MARRKSFDLETRLRPSDDVLYRELDEEAVLLHLGRGIYFGLDQVGRRVWELIVANGHVGAVVEALIAEFDVERERAEKDTLDLVKALAENDLVVSEPPP